MSKEAEKSNDLESHGEVENVELDAVVQGLDRRFWLIGGQPVPTPEAATDSSTWHLEGGCTMAREKHREHLRKLFRLGQRP